jgi:hypothetical protein
VHAVAATDDSIEASLIERVLGEYRDCGGVALWVLRCAPQADDRGSGHEVSSASVVGQGVAASAFKS